MSDIEVTIDGFVRGGKRVERGLRGLREEWEAEVRAARCLSYALCVSSLLACECSPSP